MINHIGVFVDFTDLCDTSVNFTKAFAEITKAKVSLIHITASKNKVNETSFDPYLSTLRNAGIKAEPALGYGVFELTAPELVNELEVDLVIVGTHGVKGIKQHLFGSNILHLVKNLPVTTLVVQKQGSMPATSSPRILLPMGGHHNFITGINETARMALILNAEVLVYTIHKTDAGASEEIMHNRQLAENRFTELGVKFSVVNEPATVYSFGYGKQINEFAKNNSIDFISVMSQVSSNLAVLGDTDKENIILNANNIPVFCVNA